MFIFEMHPCIYEKNPKRHLSRHLKSFLFLRFWQFIDQHVAPLNFLI